MSHSEYEGEMLGLLISGLSSALDGVAEVTLETSKLITVSASDPGRADALLNVKGKGEPALLVVEVLRNAYPRDIRSAMWVLDEVQHSQNRELIKMVAAETLSPGAKQMLKDHGFGYFEKSGSLYLRTKRWFINIERPSKPPSKSNTISLFTDAREGVVHALLMHTRQWMTGGELAELAQTSAYTCSVVLQELERREWCDSTGGGRTKRRRLVKPGKLLDAWAEHWAQREEQITKGYLFVEHPKHLLREVTDRVQEAGLASKCIVSGAAAGNAFAPLLTSTDAVDLVIPPGWTQTFMEALKMKPVAKGANVSLIQREAPALLFSQPFNNYSCNFASPYILYLDLLDGRGRNKELAEYVREKLEQTWPI
ncbi:hypothetical protein LOY67_27390 [Pseudomonas sp. B21-056]|jgi:hypothetical protein|uniref:type IV toxin-antitoxin system AbiEi family antitoxin n=1 Tax=Pseudomonas sp. B21-056 TaxID=2895495 RepID=UPI00222F3788|nr:type IV toxin-antitoxin system AbiEi family antitoxin [Pseudomonas sp. B21-056]UZE23669.1 hypothetical protein LOY67_27390 [Pseudomonas sp. B21-056]